MSGGAALRAVLFDVDGTLAETERDGHRPAFNAAFARHGLSYRWDPAEYGELLAVTGGRRRIAGYLRSRGHPDDELAEAIHRTKTALFRDLVRAGGCPARPGVRALVAELGAAGIRVGVATTGTRAWVEPLLADVLGPDVPEVVVTGDEVRRLKPDPEVYRRALRELGLPPEHALAVEDSGNGLRAAEAAGLATVIVTNGYTRDQDFSGAAAVRERFDGPDPLTAAGCRAVHATWWSGRIRQDP